MCSNCDDFYFQVIFITIIVLFVWAGLTYKPWLKVLLAGLVWEKNIVRWLISQIRPSEQAKFGTVLYLSFWRSRWEHIQLTACCLAVYPECHVKCATEVITAIAHLAFTVPQVFSTIIILKLPSWFLMPDFSRPLLYARTGILCSDFTGSIHLTSHSPFHNDLTSGANCLTTERDTCGIRFTWNPLFPLLIALIGHCIILQKAPIKKYEYLAIVTLHQWPLRATSHTPHIFFFLGILCHLPIHAAEPPTVWNGRAA